jgi:fructosamine-3-kinase
MSAQSVALNPEAILAVLGAPSATAITSLPGGTSTALWRVTHGSMTSVLRVFGPEQTATCQREIEAMEAVRLAQAPVPTIHARGIWHERPVLLLSWCRGGRSGRPSASAPGAYCR